MRLADGSRILAEALARELEGSGTGTADGFVGGDPHGLPPPRGTIVRTEVGQPPGVVRALLAGELSRRPGERVPDRRDDAHGADDEQECTRRDERAADGVLPLHHEPGDGDAPPGERHDERSGENERGERATVGDAVRAERPVLDERGARERPASDGERGKPGHERKETVGQARLGEDEPEREHRDSADDAGPRLREQQRDARPVDEQQPSQPDGRPWSACEPQPEPEPGVGKQRERVPVPHRLPEPRDPVAVLEERGYGDSEERPGERGCDDDRDDGGEPARAGGERSTEEAEREEREVDEPPGEPVPRAIAGDRPDDGDARPRRQRAGADDDGERRGVEPPQRQDATQGCGERDGGDEESGNPDVGERVVARPLAREHGQGEQHRDREEQACRCDPSSAERGSPGRVHDAARLPASAADRAERR